MAAIQQSNGDMNALAVAEQLPADIILLKMENEQIFSIARATPRDPMKIVGQLQALVDAYPAAADEAIYSKPVGTVMQITCGNKKCGVKYEVAKIESDTACPACDSPEKGAIRKVKKFAEGLSIRAAESIRSIFGYTRMATTTEMLDDGKAKLTGVLVDYAAGNITSDERIVSPMYRAKNGAMTRTPEDRFLNVVVKAEKSKLRRDVILDSTPNIVKAMFRDACEKKLADLVQPEVIEQKIIPAFADYGITAAHLDKIIGRPYKLGWREGERLECRKILNALKHEETTPRELLEGLEDNGSDTVSPPTPTGGATVEDVMKPAAQATQPNNEVREPPTTPAGNAPAQQSQADDEALTVAQWRADVSQMESIRDLEKAKKMIPVNLSEGGRHAVLSAIEMQEAKVRGSRGQRSNGTMFDTRGSATEQGA